METGNLIEPKLNINIEMGTEIFSGNRLRKKMKKIK